jgi:hypothetical protein
MTRDQALAKIKKCLALGKSANEHEAAAALRHAQALMREHKLSDDDVVLANVCELSTRARSTAINQWEAQLAQLISEATGCDHYHARQWMLSRRGAFDVHARRSHDVAFVGFDAAPQLATYAFNVLSRKCAAARLTYVRQQPANCKPITKTARGDSFAMGWVAGVRRLVDRYAGGTGDQALIAQYMAAKHSNLAATTPRNTALGRNVGRSDIDGYRAGQHASLDRGLTATQRAGLLK